jgi:hypothetical protein
VPRPRRDRNTSVDAHASLGQLYPSTWLDGGDIDEHLAERNRAEKVKGDATDTHRPGDRLVDHVGEKCSRWSTVLGLAVPWALGGACRLVSSLSAG